jgi:hypothetical protein
VPPYLLKNQASFLYILKLFNKEYNTTTLAYFSLLKLYVIYAPNICDFTLKPPKGAQRQHGRDPVYFCGENGMEGLHMGILSFGECYST